MHPPAGQGASEFCPTIRTKTSLINKTCQARFVAMTVFGERLRAKTPMQLRWLSPTQDCSARDLRCGSPGGRARLHQTIGGATRLEESNCALRNPKAIQENPVPSDLVADPQNRKSASDAAVSASAPRLRLAFIDELWVERLCDRRRERSSRRVWEQCETYLHK